MKHISLFEEFVTKKRTRKIGDKPIDYVLSDKFFKGIKVGDVSIDRMGVYNIKNWKVY